jgi:hypothetical protein
VIDYKENETFILADSENNYHVKYTYKKLSDNKTELEYFEWVKNGKLDKPFTLEKLEKLNEIL